MKMKRLFTFACLLLAALLVAPSLKAQLYDLVVAKDGSGNYDNIQDAVNAIRDYKPEGRQRILVKKGVYEEKLVIPSYKTNISLIGEDRDSTIIVWHDHANVIDPAGRKIGTFRSYTVLVNGPGFEVENLTISNDAMTYHNPLWNADRKNNAGVGQAVALHVEGDRAVFRNCRLLGFQDTVFNGNEDSRQLFVDCYIEGTVDFIFGPATCWFEHCHLHAISKGYLTAASTPAHHPYGYVFNRCVITTDSTVVNELLGRPWRNYAAVIFKECELPASIHPRGWDNWRDPVREKTSRYREYHCSGPGADRSQRALWTRELTDAEASQVTFENVFRQAENIWYHTALPISFREAVARYMDSRTRYVGATLETPASGVAATAPENEVEPLRIVLDSVDCTTFVEYVAAERLSREKAHPADSVFQRFVQVLRYRDGRRGNYATRLHYFSDWIADNVALGLVEEVTASLPGARTLKQQIDFMTAHRQLYPRLAASDSLTRVVRAAEQRLSAQTSYYVPVSKVAGILDQLEEGDIVAFVTDKKGLDISHVGFVWNGGEGKALLHASSAAGCVTVSDRLDRYAKKHPACKGVRILRLKCR